MNILLVSAHGALMPIAERMTAEGHSTLLYVEDTRARGVEVQGVAWARVRGSLLRTPELVKVLMKDFPSQLVVVDREMGAVGDAARSTGVRVWGASKWTDHASSSRDYSTKLLLASLPPSTILVGRGESAVWGGLDFQLPHILTPYHGFMDGGRGVALLAGVVVERTGKVEELCLLEKMLKRSPYLGPVALLSEKLSVGVEEGALYALLELVGGDVVRVMMGESVPLDGAAIGVLISLPPFPFFEESECAWVKERVEEGARKHLWLECVGGKVGWVTARGKDLSQARRRVYRTLLNLQEAIPQLQFRGDIGA